MTIFSIPAKPVSRARYLAAATVEVSTEVAQSWLTTYRAWVLRSAVRRLSQEPAPDEDATYAEMRGM
jgi:hypothetical protein